MDLRRILSTLARGLAAVAVLAGGPPLAAWSQSPDLDSAEISLSQALARLEAAHGASINYLVRDVADYRVSASVLEAADVERALTEALVATPLRVRSLGARQFVLQRGATPSATPERLPARVPTPAMNTAPGAYAPARTSAPATAAAPPTVAIAGVITDTDGEPLIGATVAWTEDPNVGTVTDVDGRFALTLPTGEGGLRIGYVGYETVTVPLSGRTDFTVALEPNALGLEEVVVTGYGTQRKSDIIGAVSTIQARELAVQPTANFDAGLQGLAAGVSVLSQSGKPGAPASIQIRGASSVQSNTEPLWVIDGMPIYSAPGGLGTSGLNPMSLINPNDIASIQVLKDAAATSIYGSRGSSGVILVTTKTAEAGEAYTTFTANTGVSQLPRTPADVGYANSAQWFAAMDTAFNRTRLVDFALREHYQRSPFAFEELTREQVDSLAVDTDWFAEAFGMGRYDEFGFSTARGTDESGYFVSANYRNDEGVLDENRLRRFSVRSNLRFEPIDRFSVEARLNVSHTDNERRGENLTTLTRFSLPWHPVRSPANPAEYYNPYTGANLAAALDPANVRDNVKQYRGLGVLALEYDVPWVRGLRLRSEGAVDLIQSNITQFSSAAIRLNGAADPSAYAREEAVTFQSVNYNAYGNYDRAFGAHDLSLVAGVEAQRINQYIRAAESEDLPGPFQELGRVTNARSARGGLDGERYLLGYFGRANYKLRDRYLVGVSARRDGSSVFADPANRWGTFVAGSLGWIISEEPFLGGLSDDVFIKLRGSYGQTGNQGIPNGLEAIQFNEQVFYGDRGISGTIPGNLPNRSLRWEKTASLDLGLDFGLWGNRIEGSVSYFRRDIDDMLLEAQLPSSAGVSPSPATGIQAGFLNEGAGVGPVTNRILQNIGAMSTSGVEFELYTINFDTRGFSWRTSFNVAFNANVIEALTPDLDASGRGIQSAYTLTRVGDRRSVWYLADWAGVDPDNGLPLIYKLDREHFQRTGETRRAVGPDGVDSLIVGTRANVRDNRFIQDGRSSDPTFFGGLNNRLTFGDVDFGFLFTFSGGNYLLDYDRQVLAYANPTRNILVDAIENSWNAPGDEATYPKLVAYNTHRVGDGLSSDFGDENVYHTRELYDASFVRLRNVTLGYTLPQSALDRLGLQRVRAHVTGTNLLLWTKYPGFDPEGTREPITNAQILRNNTPIPQLRTVMAGIEATF